MQKALRQQTVRSWPVVVTSFDGALTLLHWQSMVAENRQKADDMMGEVCCSGQSLRPGESARSVLPLLTTCWG